MTAKRVASQTRGSTAPRRAPKVPEGHTYVPAHTIELSGSWVVPYTDELGTWDLGPDGRVAGIPRTGRDSNPREAFTPTRFPGVRLKPLGHPSFT
jgi:hypothetical protein